MTGPTWRINVRAWLVALLAGVASVVAYVGVLGWDGTRSYTSLGVAAFAVVAFAIVVVAVWFGRTPWAALIVPFATTVAFGAREQHYQSSYGGQGLWVVTAVPLCVGLLIIVSVVAVGAHAAFGRA